MKGSVPHTLSKSFFKAISKKFPNIGKNSHVGHLAVEIVQDYFNSNYKKVQFKNGAKGVDLRVTFNNKSHSFEIKGTASPNVDISKLRVSGRPSYDALIKGMILIRVTGVGTNAPTLHFLKHNRDFILTEEPRWAVKNAKKKINKK